MIEIRYKTVIKYFLKAKIMIQVKEKRINKIICEDCTLSIKKIKYNRVSSNKSIHKQENQLEDV